MNKKYLLSLLLFALLGTQPSSAQGFFKKLTKAVSSVTETVNKVTGNSANSKSSTKTTQSSQTATHARFKDFFDSNIENTYQIKEKAVVEIALTNKKDYAIMDSKTGMIYIPGVPQKYVVEIYNPDGNTTVKGKLNVCLYRQDLPCYIPDALARKDQPLYDNNQGVSFETQVEQKPDGENLVWWNKKDIVVSDCYVHAIKSKPYFHCKIKNLRNTAIKFTRSNIIPNITAYDGDGSNFNGSSSLDCTYINRCKAFPGSSDDYFGSVRLEPNATMDYDVCISESSKFARGEFPYLRLYLLDEYEIYCTNLQFK